MLKKMFEEKLSKIKPKKESLPEPENSSLPSLYLSSSELPEIEDFEVGEEYYLIMKVKQESKSSSEYDDKKKCSATFKIKEIGVLDEEEDEKSESPEHEKSESDSKESIKKKYLS